MSNLTIFGMKLLVGIVEEERLEVVVEERKKKSGGGDTLQWSVSKLYIYIFLHLFPPSQLKSMKNIEANYTKHMKIKIYK